MRTLLIDDDPAFRRLAGMALSEAGVAHVAVSTPAEALALLDGGDAGEFDLLLLDQELPGMTGQELLARLRADGRDVPVVLVSVRDGVDERVRALESGADDYVVKPTSFDELVARLRAVVRRSRGAGPIRLGSLQLDPHARTVRQGETMLELTPLEFDLLFVLAQAQDRTLSRKELLRRVWGMYFQPGTNFVQVHMSRLRAKLEAAGALAEVEIETVRGRGYRLVSRPATPPTAPPTAPTSTSR